jgi:uncharacterized protein (TIGR00369 family)
MMGSPVPVGSLAFQCAPRISLIAVQLAPRIGSLTLQFACAGRGRPSARSRSLSFMENAPPDPVAPTAASVSPPAPSSDDGPPAAGPRSLDGVTTFMGMHWDDPQTVRLAIRPELMNNGGLLSGVVTYALVDYCMGSTLWAETSEHERIATISISINYIQTATEGEIVCRTELDRRNRTVGILKSEVRHEDGRLLVTAVGSYSIRVPRELRQ